MSEAPLASDVELEGHRRQAAFGAPGWPPLEYVPSTQRRHCEPPKPGWQTEQFDLLVAPGLGVVKPTEQLAHVLPLLNCPLGQASSAVSQSRSPGLHTVQLATDVLPAVSVTGLLAGHATQTGFGWVLFPPREKVPTSHKLHVLPPYPSRHTEQLSADIDPVPGVKVLAMQLAQRGRGLYRLPPLLQVPFSQRVQLGPPKPARQTEQSTGLADPLASVVVFLAHGKQGGSGLETVPPTE